MQAPSRNRLLPRAVLFILTAWLLSSECFAQAKKKPEEPPPEPSSVARIRNLGDKPYGLTERKPWTTSTVIGTPEPPPPYRAERVFPQLTFQQPVELERTPDGKRLVVIQLKGEILSFPADGKFEKPDLMLDMSLAPFKIYRAYGIAFAPDFEKSRDVYICYVKKNHAPDGTRVSRFKVLPGEPPVIDPASEEVLITWIGGGHNGGCMKFGPDGYLYITSGDGSDPAPPDAHGNGQDLSELCASVLRIDVSGRDGDLPYKIPADNPFVDLAGARGEVWAYGLRNPWKISFDRETGKLWCGDIGWELWEMVFDIQRGGNYGWSIIEGRQPIHSDWKRGPTPIIPAVVDHDHTEARSLTGGYVYHGKRLPELDGVYVYGDYITGKIWGFRYDGQKVTEHKALADTHRAIITFGEDADGELYFIDYAGPMYRLVPSPPHDPNQKFPQKLSETGLFSSVKDHQLAPGVLPYSINAEMWSDGAHAQRFLALPNGSQIHRSPRDSDEAKFHPWEFPQWGLLCKTLSLETKPGDPSSRVPVETQILQYDGFAWNAYTYAWNDDQADGTLVPADGMERKLELPDAQSPTGKSTRLWHYNTRVECTVCHNPRPPFGPGFAPNQLDREHNYGGVSDNQLRVFDHIGVFTPDVLAALGEYEGMPSPYDEKADLEKRARAYLQVNCAHCHVRGGGGTAPFVLKYETPLDKINLVDVKPLLGSFGMPSAREVAPGDPFRSTIYYRLSTVGMGRMPQLGSTLVDDRGLKLMRDWIASIPLTDKMEKGPAMPAKDLTALEQVTSATNSSGDAAPALGQLLASTRGAMLLCQGIEENRVSAAVRDKAVAMALEKNDPYLRGLFERFLPEDQRIKRLGNTVKPAEILAYRGDAEKGKKIFFEAKLLQCKNCHRIGEVGTAVGPDLNDIGKKNDRAAILESILEPSKKIDPKYAPYVIETEDGVALMGLLEKETETEYVLKDVQGKLVHVAKPVETFAPLPKSMMPDLMLRDMTAQEVADLIEYLSSLK